MPWFVSMSLVYAQGQQGQEGDEEYQAAEEPEHVHGLLAEVGEKPQREQIQVTVEETVKAKFGLAVLAGLVVYYLLADLVKTGVLGQVGYVAVHLAVHLDILDHLATVSLEPAVEVVQVVHTANLAGGSVEELVGIVLDRGS